MEWAKNERFKRESKRGKEMAERDSSQAVTAGPTQLSYAGPMLVNNYVLYFVVVHYLCL